MRALRIHQWVKNLLIFVPLLLAHQVADIQRLRSAMIAFFSFSLFASSVYLLNDLLDVTADRQHPVKRHRPFAAGSLDCRTGLIALLAGLAVGSLAALWFLPAAFAGALLVYLTLAAGYSFRLKRMAIVDVLALAALYSLRVLAGGVATEVPVSNWLLGFAMFFFLSLALMKRYSELVVLQSRPELGNGGRRYTVANMEVLRRLGPAMGYLSVLVFLSYLASPAVTTLYHRPAWLLGIAPLLLYWTRRVWSITRQGRMTDDPVVFAVTDPGSYAVGATVVLLVVLASV